jgi:hypothetical protein
VVGNRQFNEDSPCEFVDEQLASNGIINGIFEIPESSAIQCYKHFSPSMSNKKVDGCKTAMGVRGGGGGGYG